LLIVTNTLNAILATGLALGWWAGLLQVWHILAASFGSGVIASVIVPASQSVVPAAAGEDHLPGAVALNSIQYNVARAVGPALGGIALAWGGPGWCFLFNALRFLVLFAVFAFVRAIPQPETSRRGILAELQGGIRYLAGRKDLRVLLTTVGILALGGAPVVSMLPPLTKDLLRLDASAFSMLVTAFGTGAAVAGIVATLQPALKRMPRLLLFAVATVGAADAALAWHQPFWLAVGMVGLAGTASFAAFGRACTIKSQLSGLLHCQGQTLPMTVSGIPKVSLR
jgi:MFS family permease